MLDEWHANDVIIIYICRYHENIENTEIYPLDCTNWNYFFVTDEFAALDIGVGF